MVRRVVNVSMLGKVRIRQDGIRNSRAKWCRTSRAPGFSVRPAISGLCVSFSLYRQRTHLPSSITTAQAVTVPTLSKRMSTALPAGSVPQPCIFSPSKIIPPLFINLLPTASLSPMSADALQLAIKHSHPTLPPGQDSNSSLLILAIKF